MTSKKHQRLTNLKKDKEEHYLEEYLVRFTNGKQIYVDVKVKHGNNEKCHHQDAIEIAQNQYPNLEIFCCYYC